MMPRFLYQDGVRQLVPEPTWRPRDRASSINRRSTRISESQVQVSADGDVIPIVYGYQRIGAQVLTWVEYQDDLVVHVQWCIGGRYGLDSISVQINDAAPPAGVTVETELGTTTQSPQSTMIAAVPGFADDLVADVTISPGISQPMGIANTVLTIPAGAVEGVPQVSAVGNFLQCYDPRLGVDINDPANWNFTKNPSLILADFISSSLYGWGKAIDWASVATCADANDEIVATDGPRRQMGLSILTRQNCQAIVDQIKIYAGVFVNFTNDEVVLVPDRPSAVSRVLTDKDFLADSMRLRKGRQQDAPTVIDVEYTDTTTTPWTSQKAQAQTPGLKAGTEEWRYSLVSLPGIQNHEQAYREAVERLNRLTAIDLSGSHVVSAEGLQDLAGDVLQVTHRIGLQDKFVRLLTCQPAGPHTWSQTWEEYSAAIYSDEAIGATQPPDTHLPDPLSPPVMDSIAVTERPYVDQNGRTYSTIRVSWTGVSWGFVSQYLVKIQGTNIDQEGIISHSGRGVSHVFISHDVKQGVLHTISVQIIGTLGVIGMPAQQSITPLGKLLNPTNVPSISGFEAGDYVSLKWGQAVDEDLTGYQIRRQLAGEGLAWEAQEIVANSFRGDQILLSDQPEGIQRYSIRAHDSRFDLSQDWDYSVGFSPVAAFTDIEVTPFRGGSQRTRDIYWQDTTLVNMSWALVAGLDVFAAADYGDDWGPDVPWSSEIDHWILPYASAAQEASLETNIFDVGTDLKGRWSWNTSVEVFSVAGGLDIWEEYIRTATEAVYPSFTETPGRNIETTARYAGARVVEAFGDPNSTVVVSSPISLSLSQETRTEEGSEYVVGSAVVSFQNPFQSPPAILLTVEATDPRFASYDNVTTTGFTVYVWRQNSASDANVSWIATG